MNATGIARTREEDFILRTARVVRTEVDDAAVDALLADPLDWGYIVIAAAKHKVLPLLWHNVLARDLVRAALRTGGLTKLWAHYLNQLYVANAERSRAFVATAEALAREMTDKGIAFVLLKGTALIGDLYVPENRMLHDIDVLIHREDAARVRTALVQRGYRQGVFDDASGTLRDMDERVARFWIFQNHTMPPLFRPTGQPLYPMFKIQVGFDFFDNYDDFHIDGAEVIQRAHAKRADPRVRIPSHNDMVINLCAHIYREGVSLAYADANDNWQLTKFCDLQTYLHVHGAEIDRTTLLSEVRRLGLERPYFFALHHLAQVYPDSWTPEQWVDGIVPAELEFLSMLRDGRRSVPVYGAFADRFWCIAPPVADPRSGWNRYVGRDTW